MVGLGGREATVVVMVGVAFVMISSSPTSCVDHPLQEEVGRVCVGVGGVGGKR